MLQTHSGDLIKVGGVNATAIAVSLSGLETVIRIAGLLAALIYTSLKIADWVLERRARKSTMQGETPQKEMDPLMLWLVLALLLTGCAGPRSVAPSTLEPTLAIQSASVGTVRAQASTAKAKASVKTAADAVAVLERTATAEQRPAVIMIKDSLQVAHTEIREAEMQLLTVSNSLTASDGQLRRLQAEVDMQAAKLTVAERRAAAYHRLKFWLVAAAAGFAFYATMRITPPLGPYTWWIAGAMAMTAGGIAFYMI